MLPKQSVRFWSLSQAPSPLFWHSLALCLICICLQTHAQLFVYQSESLWNEPWRLWTAHVVHVGWMHAALNLTALGLLAWIFPEYPPRRFWLLLCLGSPILSVLIYFSLPDLQRYAGLSGILHGIYISAAIHAFLSHSDRLVATILCLGLTIKLIVENTIVGHSTAELIGAPVLTQAHYLGVAIALLLGCCFGHFYGNNSLKATNENK